MMDQRTARDGRPDDGSALILVLVLMVVGALIVLPLMDFAMSVGRANTVLSRKTARVEAVKAGLRMAVGQPTRLYATCAGYGPSAPLPLVADGLAIDVDTTCHQIAEAVSLSTTEVRYGLAAVQVGQTVPPALVAPPPAQQPYVPPASPDPAGAWIADTRLVSETNTLWLPDLPVHGTNSRFALGHDMPAIRYDTAKYPLGCKVYFPGTYTDPVTITGATYFTSGVYYFENTITVSGNADVVVGHGATTGCTTDQFAAFYAQNAPAPHYISGAGATFVFGAAGRLVVNNTASTSVKLKFNQRYVLPTDLGAAPSVGVSIATVNGMYATDGTTGIDLDIPGVLRVPLSRIGGTTPEPATREYKPSTLVPGLAPETVPGAPTIGSVASFNGGVQVSWTPPASDGNSQILGYTVRVTSGISSSTCVTVSALTCVVKPLTNGQNHRFRVEARNAIGTGPQSAQSAQIAANGSTPPPTIDPGTLPPYPTVLVTATPVIDFELSSATATTEIHIPGYVSIPQGRLRLNNPRGLAATFAGGVLAASFDVIETRVAPPIGLSNPVVHRTFKIVTTTRSGNPRVVSNAIVQVGEAGGFAINSWEVQSD